MRLNRLAITLTTLGLIAVLAVAWFVAPSIRGAASQAHAQTPLACSGVPKYQHIFYVMMENHSYDEIIGSSNAPQINALAHTYAWRRATTA